MSTRFPEHPFENPRYPLPRLSVEVAVMTIRDGELQVLMVPRSEHARDGRLVLPGTFVTEACAFGDVARQLVMQYVGPGGWAVEQVGVFSEPGRDPRGWAVSTAFLVAMDPRTLDAYVAGRAECHVVSVDPDPDGRGVSLSHYDRRVLAALDHHSIIAEGVRHMRDRIEGSLLPFRFLGEDFTMLELLQVHEAVLGSSLDKSNFRKRMLAKTFPGGLQLQTTGLIEHGPHRPAAVYYLGKS